MNKINKIMSPEESSMSEDEDGYLPVVAAPYLPCIVANNKLFTLVLDLDETLIHYFDAIDKNQQN
jgi:hypothetical protein